MRGVSFPRMFVRLFYKGSYLRFAPVVAKRSSTGRAATRLSLSHFEIPNGYHFVPYKPGDKDAWIDIELSAEEIIDKEQGEKCWQRYFGKAEPELSKRMYFIEDKFGKKVATATISWNPTTIDHLSALRDEYNKLHKS